MSQQFINLRALRDERFKQERAAFIQRHRKPLLPLPWLMVVVAYSLGLLTVLIASR